MIYKPNSIYYAVFTTTSPNTGAAKNADSLPTAIAVRNGVDDGSFSLTVVNIDIGRYRVSGTIPAYANGDTVQIVITAVVDGITDRLVVGAFRVDTRFVSDLKDFDYTTQECILTSAYNAAKTASSQTSVDTVASNVISILSTVNHATHGLNAILNRILEVKAKTDNLPSNPATETSVLSIPTNPLLTNDIRLNNLDAAITSRLALSDYTAPDNANINSIKLKTDNLPSDPSSASIINSAFDTLNTYVDEIETIIKNATYGLSALKNSILACAKPTDAMSLVPEVITDIKTGLALEQTSQELKLGVTTIQTLVIGQNEMMTEIKTGFSIKNLKFIQQPDNTVDIVAKQGTTWEFNLVIHALQDLTGYTFAGHVRASYKTPIHSAEITTHSFDPNTNNLIMRVTATDSKNVPAYYESIDETLLETYKGVGVYVYDIEMTSPDGFVSRILEGKLYNDPEATK